MSNGFLFWDPCPSRVPGTVQRERPRAKLDKRSCPGCAGVQRGARGQPVTLRSLRAISRDSFGTRTEGEVRDASLGIFPESRSGQRQPTSTVPGGRRPSAWWPSGNPQSLPRLCLRRPRLGRPQPAALLTTLLRTGPLLPRASQPLSRCHEGDAARVSRDALGHPSCGKYLESHPSGLFRSSESSLEGGGGTPASQCCGGLPSTQGPGAG